MHSIPTRSPAYDRKTIALHWLTALLVALLWLSAQFIDSFPIGPSRWNMVGTHMLLGLVMAVLIVHRVRWRLTQGTPSAPALKAAERVAMAVHIALYLLVIVSVALGLWNAWARGEHFFNLFQIPAFDAGNKALRKWAGNQHKLAVNVLLIVAGLHALAGLAHHLIWRDGVLQRMLPQRFSDTSKDQ